MKAVVSGSRGVGVDVGPFRRTGDVDRARPEARPARREEVQEVLAGSVNDPRAGLRLKLTRRA